MALPPGHDACCTRTHKLHRHCLAQKGVGSTTTKTGPHKLHRYHLWQKGGIQYSHTETQYPKLHRHYLGQRGYAWGNYGEAGGCLNSSSTGSQAEYFKVVLRPVEYMAIQPKHQQRLQQFIKAQGQAQTMRLSEKFCLKCNNFEAYICLTFRELKEDREFSRNLQIPKPDSQDMPGHRVN